MGLAGRKAHAAVECFLRPHGGSVAYSNPARSGPFISVLLSATLCSTLLSDFSISAFQLFPIGPMVSGPWSRFRFQVSAFQLFPFVPSSRGPWSCGPWSRFRSQHFRFQSFSFCLSLPLSQFQLFSSARRPLTPLSKRTSQLWRLRLSCGAGKIEAVSTKAQAILDEIRALPPQEFQAVWQQIQRWGSSRRADTAADDPIRSARGMFAGSRLTEALLASRAEDRRRG